MHTFGSRPYEAPLDVRITAYGYGIYIAYEENSLAPATSGFFSAMDRQLPIIRSAARVEKSAFAAPLGCEKLLLRYIEAPWSRF